MEAVKSLSAGSIPMKAETERWDKRGVIAWVCITKFTSVVLCLLGPLVGVFLSSHHAVLGRVFDRLMSMWAQG